MKWVLNLITATLAVYVSMFFNLNMSLSEITGSPLEVIRYIVSLVSVYAVIFGVGAGSLSYGSVQLMEKLVMKEDKFKSWLFMAISLPLSAALGALAIYSLLRSIFI